MSAEFDAQVRDALKANRGWMDLRQIAEACGSALSGSGWQSAADRLVARGDARVAAALGAPMGRRYRIVRKRRAAADKGLGPTQMMVLRCLLAEHAKSLRTLAQDHPQIGTQDSARSAVMRLARRGLVDVAGWDAYDRRTYKLTEKGSEVARGLDASGENDHEFVVEHNGAGWVGRCDCGWKTKPFDDRARASRRVERHVAEAV